VNRVAQPGERLSEECGHHCGIQEAGSVTIIGHCKEECCHDVGRVMRGLLQAEQESPAGCPESGCGRTREPCDGCQQAETEDLIRGLRGKEMAE
jgi:hypothetical protein